MTVLEALDLIRSSAPWQAAGGDPAEAWKRWKASNPTEAAKLLDYASQPGSSRPVLATKYGRGMVELVSRGMYALVPAFLPVTPPPPPPPPPPTAGAPWHHAEAIAAPGALSSAPWRELHAAGFRRLSTTIGSGDQDDSTVIANLTEIPLVRAQWKQLGGLMGGFVVMRGPNVVTQATTAVTRALQLQLDYLLFDVEDYKADGGEGRPAADRFAQLVAKIATTPYAAVSSFITFGDTGGATPLCSPWQDGKPIVEFGPASSAGWHGFFEAYLNTGAPASVAQCVNLSTVCYDKFRSHVAIGSQDVAAQVAAVLAHVQAGKVARGFSVWDAPNLEAAEIAALGAAIAAGAAVA